MFVDLSEEWDTELRSGDPLGFPGYAAKLSALDGESVRTGLADGFVLIEGDFDVIGGSMGLVHGEKVVRAFDRAIEARLPVVVVTRSGGARMQEGMVSLIQLARTAAAAQRHQDAGLLSISVHLSPTTGGVFASYGSLTDMRIAESGATIGFAGPRVVEQTTGEVVTGESHTAESAFAAHVVDAVVPNAELVEWVDAALGRTATPLQVHQPPTPIRKAVPSDAAMASPAWAEVEASRAMGRPSGIHVAALATTSWTEIGSGTDPALRTAVATMAGQRVVVVASDRYGGTGRPVPAGYRLAQRGIALAGRLGLPLVTFIDMSGAEPGSAAENAGIAGEIARTHAAMGSLPTPSISLCVGEGGSGGALALAAADRFLVQEHAIFSVIGPEGAAAILERDAGRAADVTPWLKLTSADLLELGVVDAVVPDAIDAAVAAVHQALAGAPDGPDAVRVGARRERFDAVTARWLRSAADHT